MKHIISLTDLSPSKTYKLNSYTALKDVQNRKKMD